MLYSTAGYFRKRRYRQKDIEKAMVFEAIVDNPGTTRKKLHLQLDLRPNNVTNIVQELVEEQLVTEHFQKSIKKGRPEIPLSVHLDKLISFGIWVVSHELIGAVTNMNGDISSQKSIVLNSETTNESFFSAVFSLINALYKEIRREQELIGIGLSLPGIIDRKERIWFFNSRWPLVKNLSFQILEERYGIPVAVEQIIDAEFTAMISKTRKREIKNGMLIHWGFGIGASYAHKGDIVNSTAGSFCELGHLKIIRNEGDLCTCGETGCLETISSMRVLLPRLRKKYGELPDNESQLATSMQHMNFHGDEDIQLAVQKMAEAVDSAYWLIFPDTIFVYGPLLANENIRIQFGKLLQDFVPSYAKDKLNIEYIHYEISSMSPWGCTIGFFKNRLRVLLKAHH